MNKVLVEVSKCFLKEFTDYHEIDYFISDVKNVIPSFRGMELSLDILEDLTVGKYLGLFWIKGYKPNKRQIENMIKDFYKTMTERS